MKLGLTTSTRGCMVTRAAYEAVGQAAEKAGFDFIAVNDHVVVPAGIDSTYPYSNSGKWDGTDTGHCFDQLAVIAFLAGCTRRIKLFTAVMVVPHRHPIVAAKMLATADVLSEGRLIVGCGAGWMKEEFDLLGAPFEGRGLATDEYIAAFKALWTQDKPRFKGTYVNFDNVLFAPKPVQKPYPPIWIGGESKPAMRRAARLSEGWYPGSNNPQRRFDTTERLAAGLVEVRQMAEQAGRDPAAVTMAFSVQWPVSFTPVPGPDGARRLFTGSPADMAEDAAALARIGVTHVGLSLQAPTVSETLERVQRIGETVMPLM